MKIENPILFIINLLCFLYVVYRVIFVKNTPTLVDTQDKRANHRARLMTAAFYVPFLCITLIFHPKIGQAFILLMIPKALEEYLLIIQRTELVTDSRHTTSSSSSCSSCSLNIIERLVQVLGLLVGLSGAFASYQDGGALWCLGAIVLLIVYCCYLVHTGESVGAVNIDRLAKYVFGVIWIGFGLSHGIRLIESVQGGFGGGFTLLMLLTSWLGDAAAFYIGRKFGKHKAMPNVSPAKSWEGCVAVVVFSVIMCGIVPLLQTQSIQWAIDCFPPFSFFHYLSVGLIVGFVGIFGDALESLFKRAGKVKDSGIFFPGHGGILDRFDTFLLCAPVIYFYYYYIIM